MPVSDPPTQLLRERACASQTAHRNPLFPRQDSVRICYASRADVSLTEGTLGAGTRKSDSLPNAAGSKSFSEGRGGDDPGEYSRVHRCLWRAEDRRNVR